MQIFGASVGELGPHIHGRHSPTKRFVPGNFNTEQLLPLFSFLPSFLFLPFFGGTGGGGSNEHQSVGWVNVPPSSALLCGSI